MQSIMKLTTGKLAALVFLVGALALPVLPNSADAAESQATYEVENLNNSELKMTFDRAEVRIDAEGNATLKDHVTGKEQVLPKSSTDKNGDPREGDRNIQNHHSFNNSHICPMDFITDFTRYEYL